MTNYNLRVTSVTPLSKNKPKKAIILCHGFGGDGKDISSLAIGWQRFLPDVIFLSPDAPEICNILLRSHPIILTTFRIIPR